MHFAHPANWRSCSPECGGSCAYRNVPVSSYIDKLIKGYKVALCTNSFLNRAKGLDERDVVRPHHAGHSLNNIGLSDSDNCHISKKACMKPAYADVSTEGLFIGECTCDEGCASCLEK